MDSDLDGFEKILEPAKAAVTVQIRLDTMPLRLFSGPDFLLADIASVMIAIVASGRHLAGRGCHLIIAVR